MVITLKHLTLAQAAEQFSGSVTEDIRELDAENATEEGYHKLGVLDGKLLSSCYEISFLSWSIWDGEDWRDLADVDYELLERLENAESISWS